MIGLTASARLGAGLNPRGWAMALAAVAGALGACATSASFQCESDAQCQSGILGMCQPGGVCSFPSEDCPSGQRYGDLSGLQAGECVPLDGAATDASELGSSGDVGGLDDSDETGGSSGPGLDSTQGAQGTIGTTGTFGTSGMSGLDEGVEGGDASGSEAEGSSTGAPVDPDLLLWLEFEGGLPGEYLDASPSMTNGTCAEPECPATVAGVGGQGIELDGVDDAIAVSSDAMFGTAEGLTISTWIWLDAAPDEHAALVAKPVGDGIYNSWELYFHPGADGTTRLNFNMHVGEQAHGLAAPEVLQSERWTHVAATWDRSTAALWIDGVEVGSVPAEGIMIDDQDVLIGADDDHGGGRIAHFGGRMDDVRIYGRPLDDAEIMDLMD